MRIAKAVILSFALGWQFVAADSAASSLVDDAANGDSTSDDPFHFTVTGSRFPGATDPTGTADDSMPTATSPSSQSSSGSAAPSESTSSDDPFHFTVTGSRFPGATDPTGTADDSEPTNTNAAGDLHVNAPVVGIAALAGLLAI